MYKILLVDDEILVRVGMRALIDWEKEGFHIAGEASNGEAAMEMIGKLTPDIVLTDVKMPVMDGLELIRQSNACGFKCKFIILSSYDDFKYVKQALLEEACDYLLKMELEPESLLQTLKKAASQIPLKEAQQIDPSPARSLTKLLKGEKSENQIPDFPIPFHVAAVAAERLELTESMCDQTIHMIEEVWHNFGTGIWTTDDKGHVIGAIKTEHPCRLSDFYQSTDQMMRYAFNSGCFMGISDQAKVYSHIGQAYQQAVKSMDTASFNGCGLLLYAPQYVMDHSGNTLLHEEAFTNLEKLAERGELAEIARALDTFIQIIETEILSRQMVIRICNVIHFIINKAAIQWELQIPPLSGPDLKSQIKENKTEYISWLRQIKEELEQISGQISDQLLLHTRILLMKQLRDDISLGGIAEKMGYSPNHFSKLFKQKAGIGFSTYLTKLRMEEARKLLKNSDYKIYEVASMVGYDNTTYFCRVFHQDTGMTPVEFKYKE